MPAGDHTTINVKEYKEQLERLLAAHGVVLAYLFGSQAEGTAGPLSDVDIAVLLEPQVDRERWFQVRLDLTNELMGLFHRDKVDVVILNEAPPVLAYEVIQFGQLLHETIPGTRIDFEVATTHRYMDTQPLRRIQDCRLFERAEEYRHTLDLPTGR
jgi:predicted nucleotidyltransferase